jgi:hypothetical protein
MQPLPPPCGAADRRADCSVWPRLPFPEIHGRQRCRTSYGWPPRSGRRRKPPPRQRQPDIGNHAPAQADGSGKSPAKIYRHPNPTPQPIFSTVSAMTRHRVVSPVLTIQVTVRWDRFVVRRPDSPQLLMPATLLLAHEERVTRLAAG